MAGQTGKSGLLSQLGGTLVTGMAENLSREPQLGNPQMPGGVEGGIAQLRGLKIELFKEGKNKDKPYFSAFGIAVLPQKVKNRQVAGLRTIIGPEPLCETPDAMGKRKTASEHYNWYLDQLRGLGLDEFIQGVFQKAATITDKHQQSAFVEQQLMLGMESLTKSPEKGKPDRRPFFHFRTSELPETEYQQVGREWIVTQGKKTLGKYPTETIVKQKHQYAVLKGTGQGGRVYHEWCGACEYHPDDGLPTSPSEVQDSSGAPTVQPSTNGLSGSTKEPEVATGTPDPDADGAILALVASANSGEATAKQELEKLAIGAGATSEQVDAAQSWEEVYGMITGTTKTEESVPLPSDDLPPPAVDEEYMYQPLGKDGNPAKNRAGKDLPLAKCKVILVNEDEATVNLSDGKKVYMDVSWDDLMPIA